VIDWYDFMPPKNGPCTVGQDNNRNYLSDNNFHLPWAVLETLNKYFTILIKLCNSWFNTLGIFIFQVDCTKCNISTDITLVHIINKIISTLKRAMVTLITWLCFTIVMSQALSINPFFITSFTRVPWYTGAVNKKNNCGCCLTI